jgi:hypothetical protein
MPKCPSKFCDNIVQEGANYCGKCSTDLHLSKEEIENRDKLYEVFNELFKKYSEKNEEKIDFSRSMFDYMIEKHGATIAIFMFKIGNDFDGKKVEEEKVEFPKKGLYSLFLDRMKELKPNSSGVIRFPVVFEKLCASFQITKKQCWDILFMFRDFELIEIVKGQGIKINIKS